MFCKVKVNITGALELSGATNLRPLHLTYAELVVRPDRGVFEFEVKCRREEVGTPTHELIYSCPVAYSVDDVTQEERAAFQVLFQNGKGISFVVTGDWANLGTDYSKDGVQTLQNALQVMMAGVVGNVEEEIAKMQCFGWFSESGINFLYKRPGGEVVEESEWKQQQQRQSRPDQLANVCSPGSLWESPLNLTVHVLTTVDTLLATNRTTPVLANVGASLHLQLSPGGRFRFFSPYPPVSSTSSASPTLVEYESPLAIAEWEDGQVFEILFQDLKAVRLRLENAGDVPWLKSALKRLTDGIFHVEGEVKRIQEFGWFKKSYKYFQVRK